MGASPYTLRRLPPWLRGLRRWLWRLGIKRPLHHYSNHLGVSGCRCARRGSVLWCYCYGPDSERCWCHAADEALNAIPPPPAW